MIGAAASAALMTFWIPSRAASSAELTAADAVAAALECAEWSAEVWAADTLVVAALSASSSEPHPVTVTSATDPAARAYTHFLNNIGNS